MTYTEFEELAPTIALQFHNWLQEQYEKLRIELPDDDPHAWRIDWDDRLMWTATNGEQKARYVFYRKKWKWEYGAIGDYD